MSSLLEIINNYNISKELLVAHLSSAFNFTNISMNVESEEEAEDIVQFILEGVLLTAVSIFGLVGNCMSVFVLTRASGVFRQSGGSFSNLLRGLATFDALFLTFAILSFGFPELSDWYNQNVFQPIMPIVFGLLHTFRVGSVYVTLAVTFERFHAIICPLRHFGWKKYMLPFAVFVAIVYNIPKYFEMEMQLDPNTNSSVVVSTPMRLNPIYMSVYVFWSKFIFIEMIPYSLILILNMFIILKITKAAKFRSQFRRHDDDEVEATMLQELQNENGDEQGHDAKKTLSKKLSIGSFRNYSVVLSRNAQPRRTFIKKQQEEHKLGLILVGMSALFIFCQSFKIVPDMYEMIVCNRLRTLGQDCASSKNPAINVIIRLSHFLVCFNSSANFLIYYLNGEKFRKAWVDAYGQCLCPRRTENSMAIMEVQSRPVLNAQDRYNQDEPVYL